jgi:hypothetical protein
VIGSGAAQSGDSGHRSQSYTVQSTLDRMVAGNLPERWKRPPKPEADGGVVTFTAQQRVVDGKVGRLAEGNLAPVPPAKNQQDDPIFSEFTDDARWRKGSDAKEKPKSKQNRK